MGRPVWRHDNRRRYLLSGGSLVTFIILIVVIGVLLRLVAFALVRARGQWPPRGWWH
jgi:hypothetical protein